MPGMAQPKPCREARFRGPVLNIGFLEGGQRQLMGAISSPARIIRKPWESALQIMRRPGCRAHPVLPRPMTNALDEMIDLSVPRPYGMREVCGAARRLLAA